MPPPTASKTFLAAAVKHCRWLPCPPYASAGVSSGEDGETQQFFEELPAVLAGWSEDTKQHVFGVADVQVDVVSGDIHGCSYKKALIQDDRATDLQVAKVDDTLLTATSNSSGSVSVMFMELPPGVPNATTADLQFLASDGEDDSLLQVVPQLHQAPAASVDINAIRKMLLSVAGDGSISLVQLEGLRGHSFKPPSGWSGYSQGRWVDSNCFLTTGVLGGLQQWDERQGPSPTSRSPHSWGHTGCGLLDKQMGAMRQLLCLDVHPSRPTLAVTGASGGTVAVWDLRFAAAPLALTGARAATGDVCQCKFDVYSSQGTAATPGVLYCTLDGAFCVAQEAAAAAAAAAQAAGNWAPDSSSSRGGGLVAEVLHREKYAIGSFDVEPTYGRSILAATDDEHLLLLQLDDAQAQHMQF